MSKPNRNENGTFQKGVSGNPAGRPVGSKNKVNALKLSLEQEFREVNYEDIKKILRSVVLDALNGDKVAKKMIWDAAVSKASLSEDKAGGEAIPGVVIRHMAATKEGDIIDVEEES